MQTWGGANVIYLLVSKFWGFVWIWDLGEDLPSIIASSPSLHGLGTLLGLNGTAGAVVWAGDVMVVVVEIVFLPEGITKTLVMSRGREDNMDRERGKILGQTSQQLLILYLCVIFLLLIQPFWRHQKDIQTLPGLS